MKLIFGIIKIGLVIGIAVLGLALLINKTFIYEVYRTDYMDGSGIPLIRFMYMENASGTNARFVTFVNMSDLEAKKKEYVSTLTPCYGAYLYDKNNNITILNYNIVDNGMYRKVNINYDLSNYCDEKYYLEDTWIYDFSTLSTLEETNISLANVSGLMGRFSSLERNEDVIVDKNYKSEVKINLACTHKKGKYTLEIKDINENEIVVVKTENDTKQFAVYKLNNAKDYLKGLLK